MLIEVDILKSNTSSHIRYGGKLRLVTKHMETDGMQIFLREDLVPRYTIYRTDDKCDEQIIYSTTRRVNQVSILLQNMDCVLTRF